MPDENIDAFMKELNKKTTYISKVIGCFKPKEKKNIIVIDE